MNVEQVFCTNLECVVLQWNMLETAESNLENAGFFHIETRQALEEKKDVLTDLVPGKETDSEVETKKTSIPPQRDESGT